ncbi:MAG: ABC transporter permease [Dysgonomonas sp.]
MYKIYFKQAIEMLKQNKLISIITIIGTALAIMMIMVIIVTESIKNISISPEPNRDKTMYLKFEIKKRKEGNGMNSNGVISYEIYKDYLSDLKQPDLVNLQINWNKSVVTTAENKMDRKTMNLKLADANIWKIMSLSFLAGNPFSEQDFSSGLKKAVVSESTAKTLYGNIDVVSKTIIIDFKPYTIVGVVKDVSPIFNFAQSDIYIPYTSRSGYERDGFHILLLAKDKADFERIYEEIRMVEKKYNATNDEWNLTLMGPYSHSVQVINTSNLEPDVKGKTIKTVLTLCILLLIPAVNLSSFSLSGIKKRMEEIGIRKAFGAKKYIILIQVLYENLIVSLIGGVIGLVLSYAVVIWLKKWLLGIAGDAAIPLQALVSLPVFLGVFIACILLNLLSAGIPAYKASRANIIDSLNRNNL